MLTIYLHGYLKELHPEPIKVHASSRHEALEVLKQYKGFNPRKGDRHTVVVQGVYTADALKEKMDSGDIHVHPVVLGAGGSGGFFQVVIGAVLVVVGTLITPFAPMLGPLLVQAGLVMMLGGVIQMLMPQPKLDARNENELKSQYLGARGNTVAIGTTIPMIFGRHKAWGHYLSFDVDALDLNTAPASWYSSPFTDFGELTYSAAPEEAPSLDPQEEAGLPIGTFLSYASGVVTFSPAVDLPQGQFDITFNNGRVLHCFNSVSGAVNQASVLSGNVNDLPESGTPIIFSQNYV